MAVAALPDGLIPLTQASMRFYGRTAYHDYEGVALDLDERERLVADLGKASVMMLRNHGRSEEHTSELQSLMRNSYAVFCLKNKIIYFAKHDKRYKKTIQHITQYNTHYKLDYKST